MCIQIGVWNMILASHQPDFFPWMGYFYKIWQSDAFVFSDNVQYSKSASVFLLFLLKIALEY